MRLIGFKQEKHILSREKLRRWSETGVVFARGQVLLVLQPYHSGSGLDRKRVFLRFKSIIALIMTKWDI